MNELDQQAESKRAKAVMDACMADMGAKCLALGFRLQKVEPVPIEQEKLIFWKISLVGRLSEHEDDTTIFICPKTSMIVFNMAQSSPEQAAIMGGIISRTVLSFIAGVRTVEDNVNEVVAAWMEDDEEETEVPFVLLKGGEAEGGSGAH